MKKIIKNTAVALLVIGILLFGITVYHIASKKPIDNATVQISRIDFDKPFDTLGSIEIQKKTTRNSWRKNRYGSRKKHGGLLS